MAKKGNMTEEGRARLHNILDYALDNDEDYVLMQFAQMDLDYHIKRKTYRLMIKKEDSFL